MLIFGRKTSRFGRKRGMFFHQASAQAHMSTVARAAIQKWGFQLVDDQPNSPDLTNTYSQKLKRSSVVIILPEMMILWMLWTTFWWTKMTPSTQKRSVCCMTTGLSVNVGRDYVEKLLQLFSKTDSFYLRPWTYQLPFISFEHFGPEIGFLQDIKGKIDAGYYYYFYILKKRYIWSKSGLDLVKVIIIYFIYYYYIYYYFVA